MCQLIARFVLTVFVLSSAGFSAFGQSTARPPLSQKPSPTIVHGPPLPVRISTVAGGSNSQLPVWNYQVISSRDGNLYQGLIVGRNPNSVGPSAEVSVKTQIVPIILKFQTVATAFNFKTGVFSTASGNARANPTAPDPGCFAGSDNIPLKILVQSPVLRAADFNFGGTHVGDTQYTDAFQRANFWSQIDKDHYHVLLDPVVLPPLVVTVPATEGLSVPANLFAPAFTMCGPEGLVDINFFDAYVVSQLTKLNGVNPGTFPMFMIYNTGITAGDPRNLANCCFGGYHSINPAGPLEFQTYSPFDFDVSGFFVSVFNNTTAVSHEVAEWINDPYIINNTPPWGHTGQVPGCQGNLEVGDPLSGTLQTRIAMPNGYTYQLQELAFFSWFFGAPSLGIHGWYSSDGTFLADAGPPCQ